MPEPFVSKFGRKIVTNVAQKTTLFDLISAKNLRFRVIFTGREIPSAATHCPRLQKLPSMEPEFKGLDPFVSNLRHSGTAEIWGFLRYFGARSARDPPYLSTIFVSPQKV